MTELYGLVGALHLFLAVILLGILWFRWRIYRVDATRQRLFELRDELFDYARYGEIAFEHFAYTFLRLRINGMIRFSHRISFARLLMSLAFFCPSGRPEFIDKQHSSWLDSLNELPLGIRKKLKEVDDKMSVLVLQHMVLSSPITCILFGSLVLIAAPSVAVMHFWKFIAKRLPGLDLLEAQALKS